MGYSKPKFKDKYENFINGKFVAPVGGQYFENTSPIDNSLIAKYPRSQKEDVDNAVAAANAAKCIGDTLCAAGGAVQEEAAQRSVAADFNLHHLAAPEQRARPQAQGDGMTHRAAGKVPQLAVGPIAGAAFFGGSRR